MARKRGARSVIGNAVKKKRVSAHGDKVNKKPASAHDDKVKQKHVSAHDKVKKKPASAHGDKRQSASSAKGDEQEERSRWAGLRVQVKGFRTVCHHDKMDGVKNDLKDLWKSSSDKSHEEWLAIAKTFSSDKKWSMNTWGGRRVKPEDCCTPEKKHRQLQMNKWH